MATTIKTRAPEKGGLVVGHAVYAFFDHHDIPAILGTITNVSPSGTSVVFDAGPVLAAFGVPRRTTWTWRRSVGSYQPAGERTKRGIGLAIVAKR